MTRPLNPKEFADKLNRAANEGLRSILVSRFQRAVGIEVLSRTVLRTPVDTGRLRGNFQVSTAGFEDGILDAADRSGAEAIAKGTAAIGELRPFGSIYISNNLPYAIPIEEGSSKQAPQGMLRLSLMEVAEAASSSETIEMDRDI